MILAELSAYDPPVMIGIVLGCLMFIFVGGNAAAEFWRNIKDKPSGSEVMEKARKEFQAKGNFLTFEEFKTFRKSLEEKLGLISRENIQILASGHDREKSLSDQIAVLQRQINDMPSRIVADILNAKKLFDR